MVRKKNLRRLGFIGSLVGLIFLPACTSGVVLETSEELSRQVSSLNQQMSVYQKTLESHDAGRIEKLANRREMMANLEPQLDERLAIWELSNRKDAMKLYKGIQEMIQQRIKIELELKGKFEVERKELKDTQKKYKSQQKTLAALSQQLNELGKPPDRQEQLRFLLEFANETRKSLEELQREEAAKSN